MIPGDLPGLSNQLLEIVRVFLVVQVQPPDRASANVDIRIRHERSQQGALSPVPYVAEIGLPFAAGRPDIDETVARGPVDGSGPVQSVRGARLFEVAALLQIPDQGFVHLPVAE